MSEPDAFSTVRVVRRNGRTARTVSL